MALMSQVFLGWDFLIEQETPCRSLMYSLNVNVSTAKNKDNTVQLTDF